MVNRQFMNESVQALPLVLGSYLSWVPTCLILHVSGDPTTKGVKL